MSADLHSMVIPPEILKRGFWLYVWVVTLKDDRIVHYVGRTGDSSSSNAQSPVSRISGHLGPNERANALKRHLRKHGIEFQDCQALEFVAHGPLEEEVTDWGDHKSRRDRTHALERDLCEGMRAAGYEIMNKVQCRQPTEPEAWKMVRSAFAERFTKLGE
jgi:hypothetical protein